MQPALMQSRTSTRVCTVQSVRVRGPATRTEQQAAHQMLFCSRHLTTPPILASYIPEPHFSLMDVDVGQEAQGHKEVWVSSMGFLE